MIKAVSKTKKFRDGVCVSSKCNCGSCNCNCGSQVISTNIKSILTSIIN